MPANADATLAVDDVDAALLAGGTKVGRYVVLRCIGRGAMGVVYAAYDPDLDRQIALKLLRGGVGEGHEDARTRLFREAQALAQLSHPNVLPVYDVGTFEDRVFIATEFVQGKTLRDWMEPTRTWAEVLDVLIAAGRALAAAHRVGIVHRDFKPANVMVGDDGRVRVMDFGLARRLGEHDDELELHSASFRAHAPGVEITSRSLLDSAVTKAGTLLGTPAYMAPEQIQRLEVDARTDQYGFAVVAYELLFGVRPFGGRTWQERLQAMTSGRVQKPTSGHGVPVRVRKAVLRGLELDPSRRFAGMDAMLEQLQVRRLRRVAWLWASAVAMLLSSAVAWGLTIRQNANVCTDGNARLAGIWDASRQQAIEQVMLASGVAHASDTWERVRTAIDRYAAAWSANYGEACAATRVRHEQSEQLMDKRMICLQRRLWELDGLTQVLMTADASVVGTSMQAVAAMTPIGECAPERVVDDVVRRSTDAATTVVDRLLQQLARAKAMEDAGKAEDGVRLVRSTMAEARKVADPALLAETQFRLGSLESRAGQSKEAYASLFEASVGADAVRMDSLAARAKTLLVFVAAYRLADVEKAEDWSRHAGAAVARAGSLPELEGMLAYYRSALAMRQGNADEATAQARAAIHAWETMDPPPTLLISNALNALGLGYEQAGRLAEARDHFERSAASARALLGPTHPNVITKVMNVGNVELAAANYARAAEIFAQGLEAFEANGDARSQEFAGVLTKHAAALTGLGAFERALEQHERAVALQQSIDGIDHPSTAAAIVNLGDLHLRRGSLSDAQTQWQRALSIYEKVDDRAGVAAVLAKLAHLLSRLQQDAEARAFAQRSLELTSAVHGANHAAVAVPMMTLGRIELAARNVHRAAEHCRAAAEIAHGAFGAEHETTLRAEVCVAMTALAVNRPQAAVAALERAITKLSAFALDPAEVPLVRFALARTLAAQGDLVRAKTLARRAQSELTAAWAEPYRVRIDEWLTAHPD